MVQALVARGVDRPLSVDDVDLGPVGSGQVRVRIAAAGVCHSDLSMINGTVAPSFPLILGHEAAGTVIEVGDSVSRVGINDPVVLNWSPPCRSCWFCVRGEPWLCAETAGVASVPGGTLSDGTPAHRTLGIGALAEEVIVNEKAAIRVPPELPLAEAALIGCAVLTGSGAVRHTAGVREGESVAVIGLGGVGLSVLAAAKLAGASPLVAIDASPDKEALARRLGATDYLVSGPSVAREVKGLTERRGVDHAFECVGRGVTIRIAWDATRRGGQTIVVGMGSASDEVSLSALEIFHFARTLKSSVYGSSDPDVDVGALAELVQNGALDLKSLVSDRIGLDGVPEAFDRMRRGVGARSLVVF